MMDNQERRIRYDLQRNLQEKDEQIRVLLEKVQGINETKTDQRGKILDVLRKNNPFQNYSPETGNFQLEDYSEQYSEVSWESQINIW